MPMPDTVSHPHITLRLPDGSSLRAVAYAGENYPAIYTCSKTINLRSWFASQNSIPNAAPATRFASAPISPIETKQHTMPHTGQKGFNMIELKKTVKISWENAAAMVSLAMNPILGMCCECRASCEEPDYWNVRLVDGRLSKLQLAKLLDAVDAPASARVETFPEDDDSSRCLGMELSTLLLRRYLGQGWETAFANNDGIFLITPGDSDRLLNMEQMLRLGDCLIPIDELKTKQELVEYLHENGATHTTLMEFCEPYREQYHNELCWGYPISDGKHLGTFLVLVREGVLSLPYDDADKVDYELFCLEDARMCDFESIEIFLSDWKKFAEDLEHSMLCMREYLRKKKEVHDEQTN